jgi:hypothetical protein
MPAFSTTLEQAPDDIWRLVQFIADVGQRRRRKLPPLEGGSAPPPAPAEATSQVASQDAGSEDSEGDRPEKN